MQIIVAELDPAVQQNTGLAQRALATVAQKERARPWIG
jgi:hypothetical protein